MDFFRNLKDDFPIIVVLIKIMIGITILVIVTGVLRWFIVDIKTPKISNSESDIISFSTENTAFTIGKDSKYFLVYSESDSEGGINLQKYDIEKTTIFKTLSENDTPYSKVKTNKKTGIVKAELFVPENTIVENLQQITTTNEIKEDNSTIERMLSIIVQVLITISLVYIITKNLH
ncbi:MAG: hypothetical protein LBM93_14950 [Oscillospiraceae bacterium]|jgi:hypothetical protein|nr:hypothetical protein [Oscillospiraceae bacterium]